MPLPFYSSEPVYKDKFIYHLIGPNTVLLNISDSLTLKSNRNSDIIDCQFFFDANSISNFDSNLFLKDITYVLIEIFNSKGESIKNMLIKCEFISFEINFNINDSNILKVILQLKSLSSKDIKKIDSLNSFIRSIQRDIKLDSIF